MITWRRANVASIETSERAAVLPLGFDLVEQPFILEQQSAIIWQSLDTNDRQEHEIVAEVAGRYGIEAELIHEDIHTFLLELQYRGLVVGNSQS